MTVKASGIVEARRRLAELIVGLRDAASGAVTERAGEKVRSQIEASSKRILGKHVNTGNAQRTTETALAGSLVKLDSPGYLKYHAWWPFRSGMPPFVLSNALKVFKAELDAALGGKPSPLALADEAAEQAAADKAAAKFKRDIRRIYRRSAEFKEKKRAERAAARGQR